MIKTWTDEDLIFYVGKVVSIAELCRQLGLRPVGGNYMTLKRAIYRLDLDTSHFTGQSWSSNNFSISPKSKRAVKNKLLRERGHICEGCQIAFWQDQLIPLEVEHINGDSNDNRDENLLLLCCNCHALTPTWRNRKR